MRSNSDAKESEQATVLDNLEVRTDAPKKQKHSPPFNKHKFKVTK